MEDGFTQRRPTYGWLAGLVAIAFLAGALSGALVSLLLDDSNRAADAVSASGGTPANGKTERRLGGEEGSVVEAAAFAMPAVVTIINEQPPRQDSQGRIVESVSVGSGVIVDDRGFVVTNEHVIRDSGKLTVVLNDGDERAATLVSHDAPFTDLAVLRIPAGGLKSLSFGDSGTLVSGQTVIAIGSALFEYRNSVTVGVISGLKRRWLREGVFMEDLIQTDAAINSGNSGGPLVNLKGEVVGLTTNVVRRLGAAETVFGISFALSSNTMTPIVQSIVQRGQFPRPYFGIEHQNIDEEFLQTSSLPIDRGSLVRRVIDASPAQKAGIRPGDVILKIGRTEINEDATFINALAGVGVNERVGVQVWRGGRIFEVTVELTPR